MERDGLFLLPIVLVTVEEWFVYRLSIVPDTQFIFLSRAFLETNWYFNRTE